MADDDKDDDGDDDGGGGGGGNGFVGNCYTQLIRWKRLHAF